uniref:Uncharacterized protein n=1 Tax=Arundo donax TaxID=35708 RepID=A0A0A9C0F6_ARUDO
MASSLNQSNKLQRQVNKNKVK